MQVILVDPATPIAVDGLIGADFLRQTKAVINIKENTLMLGTEVMPLDEGQGDGINTILPVEYSFPNADEICNVILDANITVAAQSQQVAFARLKGENIKNNSVNICNNNKVGKTPLFVANSLDQLDQVKTNTSVITLLLVNPPFQDIVLKKVMCITKACPSPNYKE